MSRTDATGMIRNINRIMFIYVSIHTYIHTYTYYIYIYIVTLIGDLDNTIVVILLRVKLLIIRI